MPIKCNISGKDIEQLAIEQIEQGMNDLILDMAQDARDLAYEKTGKSTKRSGRLGEAIKSKKYWKGNILIGEVYVEGVDYAEYVEHGTGIHADQHRGGPRTGWLGKLPDGRIAYIEGQKPKHFMQRTVERYEGETGKYFKIKR